jgi:hypothetical protein
MVQVTTPPNIQAIVTVSDSDEDTVARGMILLCDEIDVRLQVRRGVLSEAIYYERCRNCKTRAQNKCIGGMKIIKDHLCPEGVTARSEIAYIPKRLPQHIVYIDGSLEYYLFVVEGEITPEGNLRVFPMMLGNITTYGSLCSGNMRTRRWNFAESYAAIWQLLWTGDYNYTEHSIAQLIENWSPEWQKENYRYDDLDTLYKDLFSLVGIRSLDQTVIRQPGTYDIYNARELYSSKVSELIKDGYEYLNCRVLGKRIDS